MNKPKEIIVKMFFIASLCYFWAILLLEFNTFTNVIGHFDFIPPKVGLDKFINVPIKGRIMEELETLCKNYESNTIGLSWKDYEKIVTLARREYEYPYMMFEKLYEKYKNPVRLTSDKNDQIDAYIKFLERATEKDFELLVIKTEHFGLFKKDKK